MDLQPRQLRYFMAVAEQLHFGRAAARLYISQPSLSNQIHGLERMLGTDLFVRTSRQVALTASGRALLEEAPVALAALERAAERARLTGAGIAGEIRLCYTPMANFEMLRVILAAIDNEIPNLSVVPSELFSAEIPRRILAGEQDVGLALHTESMKGIRSELLRIEPVAAVLSKRHRLADASVVPLTSLQHETILLFPRELSPAHYDYIVAACEQSGFQPRIKAIRNAPPQAMLARLQAGREVGLTPASFAFHAVQSAPDVVARRIVQPEVLDKWSIVWPAHSQSAAIERVLDTVRRCSTENDWLPTQEPMDTSGTGSPSGCLPRT
jgi:DNA-binding transcriptional LysR family regulator